jgi:hypothetical protein
MARSDMVHSNKLVQETTIGLSQIAPTWSQRLSKLPVPFPTKIKWFLDIHNKDTCVVGEAYGFTSRYARDCDKCNKFSLDFESHYVKNQFQKLEGTKEEFVQHWNKRHRNITYSIAGHRKTLKWYDSFLRSDDYIWTVK